MLKNIIFDFGGVLFDWNPRYLYRKLFETEEEVEFFLKNVCTKQWNLERDKGSSFEKGISELCKNFPEKKDLIDAYYHRWPEMLNGEIKETVAIMNNLKKNQKVLYGLTNMPVECYKYLQKTYNFLGLFKDVVVSGIEKVVKPDKKIYNILIQRNGLDPATCLFIDDKKENVIAGESVGVKSIQFLSAKNLEKDLSKLNLL